MNTEAETSGDSVAGTAGDPTAGATGGPAQAAVAAATSGVRIVDTPSGRVRQSLDLVRLVALLLAGLLLLGIGIVARETSRGLNDDLARLLGEVPHVFIRGFSLLASFGALAVPLAFMAREIVRSQTRRLIEALLTGLVAIAVVEGLDRLVGHYPASRAYEALTRVGAGGTIRPFDTYLVALLAFVAVTGVALEPLWSGLLVAVTSLYVLSVFTATQASLLSLILSLIIGSFVGVAVRYAAGRASKRPTAEQLVAALGARDIRLRSFERAEDSDAGRVYQARAVDGRELEVHVLDRELIASGAVSNVYRLIRIRKEIAPAPALSLERVAEHRSLLSMAAAVAEVPIPALLAGVRCGPDAIALVYEHRVGSPLADPSADQLEQLWQIANRLHRNRVTHRGLTATEIRIDPHGAVLLPIPKDGTAFATDLRITLDRVQLLVSTAELAGVDRAVSSARRVLTDAQLSAIVPVLQPIALSRQAREAIKHDTGLIDAIREAIQGEVPAPASELVRVERVRPRTIVSVVAGLVAAYFIVGQLSSVHLRTVLSGARWRWVPLVLAASAASYLAAALSLTGYVRERLSFPRTTLVQLAASFAGFVTPPSVGGLAVNIRYLRKARVSITGAATSVGLSQVVNGVSHVLLLIGFAAATGASAHHSLPIPGWAFSAIGALVTLAAVALALPATRRWLLARLLPPLREAMPRLLNLLTNPVKLAEGVLGAVLLNACYITALWFSVHAFAGGVSIPQVAVVYLAGAAIGSVAPTPGGLGAVEVALSTGLTAAGMASSAAISAVLLFRLATFWLPVPVGWLAFHWLQRRDAI
ncbi:MAG TPA: lysylphosphatidylglycerol synthase transmembrane domain-containing protein [Jatrophihabitans sp.]|nr:lysylphosphatidylglycerol synthase transmembrane domain-containing protein [Jatrophihabitans sp.]